MRFSSVYSIVNCESHVDSDVFLKYYRAPRYRARCIIFVLVELSVLVAQINDLRFLKQRISRKTLTEVTYAC